MDFNEKEKLAQLFGKEAAERGFEFHPMYDSRFDDLLTEATTDADRAANNALISHWQSGYSDYCRGLKLGGSDTYEIIMADHTVLRGEKPIRGLIYWDWMDNLSTMAAAAEYAAGNWSIFHRETYASRHYDTSELFGRMIKDLTDENCEDAFLRSMQPLLKQCEQIELASPVKAPEIVSRHYTIDMGWDPKPVLLYWSWMHELSVLAICAEWKANHLSWYQISSYSVRHPAVVESFNQRYTKFMSE